MASPIEFPEQNAVLAKPENMTDEECTPLPIMRTEKGECISVWKLAPEELVNINLTHCVVVGVLSGPPPIWIQAAVPALNQQDESTLVYHARAEMKAAGLWEEDADYGGDVANAVMQLIQVLSYQGHSGGSHALTMDLFSKLAHFKPLGPLTNNPDEWMSLEYADDPTWQSRRQSDAFSKDGGKTYYTLDGPEGRDFINTSAEAKVAA
ncbi:hypothetical protein [Hymenobacter algoricola]|uniref:Uncharacterized protein n=1 Tax=Hymenobacter algoricola TaxID=486267 RepID=A0ABP7NCI6_9BACT